MKSLRMERASIPSAISCSPTSWACAVMVLECYLFPEEGREMDLADGETIEVAGSGSAKYLLKNSGGVYSCTCPAWRNQSVAIEKRSCKHLRRWRGEEVEL